MSDRVYVVVHASVLLVFTAANDAPEGPRPGCSAHIQCKSGT